MRYDVQLYPVGGGEWMYAVGVDADVRRRLENALTMAWEYSGGWEDPWLMAEFASQAVVERLGLRTEERFPGAESLAEWI